MSSRKRLHQGSSGEAEAISTSSPAGAYWIKLFTLFASIFAIDDCCACGAVDDQLIFDSQGTNLIASFSFLANQERATPPQLPFHWMVILVCHRIWSNVQGLSSFPCRSNLREIEAGAWSHTAMTSTFPVQSNGRHFSSVLPLLNIPTPFAFDSSLPKIEWIMDTANLG